MRVETGSGAQHCAGDALFDPLIQSGSSDFWAMSRIVGASRQGSGLPRGAHFRNVLIPEIGLLIELYCRVLRGPSASYFPLFFLCLWKTGSQNRSPRARLRGETRGPVCFPQGKPLYLLDLNRSPLFLQFGDRLRQGDRFLQVSFSLLIRSPTALPARLHNTFCLPFLRRTRRPSSPITFKAPGMGVHLTLMFFVAHRS